VVTYFPITHGTHTEKTQYKNLSKGALWFRNTYLALSAGGQPVW